MPSIERTILRELELVKKGRDKSSVPVPKTQSAVLLLFDATGSMGPFWRETQKIMEEMVERITKVGSAKLKCCAYRDYCDGDRIFEYSKWSTGAEPLLKFIRSVKCEGGGDVPEAVEDALRRAAEEEEEVTRVILIGDAPPHSWKEGKQQATNLGEKGCPIFAFRVGDDTDTKNIFRKIADLSKGSYADLKNYEDLLDMMAITVVHDVGGSKAVEKYVEKYQPSTEVKKYSQSLPSASKK